MEGARDFFRLVFFLFLFFQLLILLLARERCVLEKEEESWKPHPSHHNDTKRARGLTNEGGLETQTRLRPCVSFFFLLFLTVLNYIMTSYGTTKRARASTNKWGLETRTRLGPCVSIFFWFFWLLNYIMSSYVYGTTTNGYKLWPMTTITIPQRGCMKRARTTVV